MAQPTVFPGDLVVQGRLLAASFTAPDGSIKNSSVDSSDPLDTDKLKHRHFLPFTQNYAATPSAERRGIFVAKAAGTLVSIKSLVSVALTGDSTITVDLFKNGTTILSTTMLINSTKAIRELVSGLFSSTAFVAGDVFEVSVTISAGTGTLGKGLMTTLVLDESPV